VLGDDHGGADEPVALEVSEAEDVFAMFQLVVLPLETRATPVGDLLECLAVVGEIEGIELGSQSVEFVDVVGADFVEDEHLESDREARFRRTIHEREGVAFSRLTMYQIGFEDKSKVGAPFRRVLRGA
jgi:hypothetical protein